MYVYNVGKRYTSDIVGMKRVKARVFTLILNTEMKKEGFKRKKSNAENGETNPY